MEMRGAVRIDAVSGRLRYPGLASEAQPLSRDDNSAKRQGLPPDPLMWIAVAVASGIVGNLAYDGLKALVKLAFRNRWGPKPEVGEWHEPNGTFRMFTLSERQIDGLIVRFAQYSEARLKAMRKTVGRVPKRRRRLQYVMPTHHPLIVTYVDAKGRPIRPTRRKKWRAREPGR